MTTVTFEPEWGPDSAYVGLSQENFVAIGDSS